MAPRAYSHLFSCLHDQAAPIGSLGRGTHHSICRTTTWRDVNLAPLDKPRILDFAILWDEDHDERVVPVVEGLLMEGLLAPVLFIGERKGLLSVAVDAALFDGTFVNPEVYAEQVQKACEAKTGEDHWPSKVVTLARSPEGLSGQGVQSLINDRYDRVLNYLRGVDALWSLGIHP